MAFDGHSNHYCMCGMEAIDVIEAYNLNFCLGNSIKYILRCGHKGDGQAAIDDLQKAVFYLCREIDKRREQQAQPKPF